MSSIYAECFASEGVAKTYIDGQWVVSSSGATVKILNPQTNEAAFQVQGRNKAQ